MNKKMREILAKIQQKQELAKGYMEGENKDVAKAEEIYNEIKELQKEFEMAKALFENEKEINKLSEEEEEKVEKKIDDKKEDKVDSTKAFAKAVRGMINKDMNEGTAADGGYTVPVDIQTKVQRLRETKESLRDLITIKKVTTKSGQETYKTRGQATGFGAVDEGGKIPKAGSPKFSRLSWTIHKYGGYMPVTNELIDDSDENIEALMTEWLADESRMTWNKLILAVIATKAQTALDGIDDIKKALNVTLGSKFKSTSMIITNDDGLQYLDTLKDEQGRYLLQPNPADPMKLRLCAGASTIPVKVYGNETLETKNGKIPFIIGDLKEGIKGFDREQLTLLSSKVAVVGSGDDQLNAYEEDLTLIRGTEREDVEMRDQSAFVNGYISVSASI